MKFKFLKSFTVSFLLAISSLANAGLITVFSDINYMNDSSTSRDQVLTNLLGAGTSVLVSKQNTASYNTDFSGFYDGLSGVSSSFTSGELTSGTLDGIDLLFINNGCCSSAGQPYSISEIAIINTFLGAGGTLGFLSEPTSLGSTPALNLFLSSLGSSMSFGAHQQISGLATINPSFLSVGVSSFQLNSFAEVIGGTAAFSLNGKAGVAFEALPNVSVPEPSTLAIFALGMIGLASRRFKKQS
jgi:hypothetical protein